MAVDFGELETWFRDRAKWLQDAARRLAERESLTDGDVQELLQICSAEAAAPDATVTYRGMSPGGLAVVDIKPILRLSSISEVRGEMPCLRRSPWCSQTLTYVLSMAGMGLESPDTFGC